MSAPTRAMVAALDMLAEMAGDYAGVVRDQAMAARLLATIDIEAIANAQAKVAAASLMLGILMAEAGNESLLPEMFREGERRPS